MTRRTELGACIVVGFALIAGCGGQESAPTDDTAAAPNSDPTSAFAVEFVAEHNRVRSEVTKPSNYVGSWVPIAPVTWSSTLAETAQVWADHLRDSSDCMLAHDPTTPYGESLAYGTVGFGPKQTVAIWEEDKAEFAYSPNYASTLGQYTQMIWRTTQRIGCAESACPTGWRVMVCYYDPPGNLAGVQPF